MQKRTNEQWLADLHDSGNPYDRALEDLRQFILAGLPAALSGWLPVSDAQFDALAEEVAQETVLKVLSHLDTFEGRSQFTTWVYKIAVRIALTELRRRRWKDVSLESLVESEQEGGDAREFADDSASPEAQAMRSDLVGRIQTMMKEELTERQMLAMKLVAIHQLPLEEAARRLGCERNALYKILHDARLRLKRRLARENLDAGEILAVFESR
jgi:RNA polymerase sigma-70 factor, ECF subfamily